MTSSRDVVSVAERAAIPGIMPVFAVTLFLSALLLFLVQPMFTKMVLPMLGGVPAVWNTAMLFFQTALLAGYAYAHLSARFLGLRWQVILHVGLLALAATALPIAVAPGWTPPTEGMPAGWLSGLFAVSVGLPFFAVSATAPLLQRWFSHSGHETADDPYYLYGASNVGSMLALLGYPVLVEPALTLAGQSASWAWSYGVLVLLIVLSAGYLWRGAAGEGVFVRPGHPLASRSEPVGWLRRAHWLALAFVPSSLLLGVTSHITTDIAAVPLFWVIPLALYLLTFVLTFSRKPLLKHEWLLRAQPVFILLTATLFLVHDPLVPLTLLHLATFFVCAMVCHGELWRRRPETSHLTEFYLWMSFGGMLGGVFNAVVSPVVFDSVVEYPLALVLACALRPWTRDTLRLPPPGMIAAILVPAAVCVAVAGLAGLVELSAGKVLWLAVFIVVAAACYVFAKLPWAFALGIAAILVLLRVAPTDDRATSTVVATERSFFGVYAVTYKRDGRFSALVHGTTIHGAQHVDAAQRREPLTYFYRTGPVGSVFDRLPNAGDRSVGVVGLGIGTTACYRRPGEDWLFYEIDPLVTELARDQRYFHYLADCAPDAPVIHGDARLSLERLGDRHFDLLILDAFSSDAVPVHLITREALALYRSKLNAGGLLMINITNRNVDLAPVLAALVADAGVTARTQRFVPTQSEFDDFAAASEWVVVAEDAATLAILDDDARWVPLRPNPGGRPWTDDYSNIFGAMNW